MEGIMMKRHNIKNLFSLLVSFLLCISSAWGQTIYNTYQSYPVQHKTTGNKWFLMRSNLSPEAKNMDTFDDNTPSFKNTYTNTDIQAAHTYIDTLYVRKGSMVTLYLPLLSTSLNQFSGQAYQRWYNFITEKPFSYGRYSTNDIVSFTKTAYRFQNGYVGGLNIGLNTNPSYLDRITFTYPTDADYNQYVSNGFDNGSAGNNYYIIACDASGYLDFTNDYGSFRTSGYTEPTISLRAIYYIIGVDGRGGNNETAMWNNGYGRLSQSAYQGGDGDGKKFLEEYNITFPCDHLGNQTDEVLSLSKDALGYRITNDQNDNLNVSISSPGNVFRLLTGGNTNSASGGSETSSFTLSGRRRVITFRKTGAGARKPWSVADGQTATVIVTKTVNGTTYNIARFNLTFKKETRLLTQHQLDRIDKARMGTDNSVTGESWYQAYFQNRTPEFLRNNYKLLTSRTLDYDPDVAAMSDQNWYYPFPVDWGYSSYAFFDGSNSNHFNGSTDGNTSYNKEPFAEWGNYAITNEYVGYGDKAANQIKRPTDPTLGGKNGDGYFIYVDASDRPGTIMTLPFTENLCKGTKLMVSAWVKSADENTDVSENSAMLFTIYGIDANGNKTALYSQSTGQITTTTYLTTGDGNEYTNQNGYGGSQNDWYQLFFSFVNDNDYKNQFVSYELKIDNNCASTAGGDFYLDEIEVFIAQPTANVTQKDFTCSGERTLLTINLDWNQLCERIGIDADGTQDATSGLDLCFIDQIKYNNAIANKELTVDNITSAIKESIVNIGAGETAGYDKEIGSLFYHENFEKNTLYVLTEKNLAINNVDPTEDKAYFYKTGTKDEDNRCLVVDFYSDMSPNTPYLLLMRDNAGITPTLEDFAQEMYDPCAMQSTIYVTSQTIIKINGEVVHPESDLCVGQAFNFSAQMRVPQLDEEGNVMRDPETGKEMYTLLEGTTVYFDWFFGDETEFKQDVNGTSLATALSSLRDIPEYRDVTNLDKVVPQAPVTGVHNGLTQADIDIIKKYVDTEAPAGGLNHKLVLHQPNLNITILESGLQLVVSPIPAVKPNDIDQTVWEKICWDYVPLRLTVSGNAPQLHAGFNVTQYPDNFNPNLRIGIEQIKAAALNKGTTDLVVSLRGAAYTNENVENLGLIDNLGGDVDYQQIYLTGSDDPAYQNLLNDPDFTQYSLPIGKIISLNAHEYTEGNYNLENEAKIRFYLDNQTLSDGSTFKFEPREGYYYTFTIYFAEHGSSVNSCWGSFPMSMKIVPKNLVWTGTGNTSNWNNDANWKRADATDLKNTDGTYTTNQENATSTGFVPMLFSNVIMPKDSKVELYMAGYGDGGNGWVNTSRPDYMEKPTENIQYDLMAYEGTDGTLSTQRYRVNICNDIHFEPGAQMLHAEQLIYNKAWTDVEITPGQWTAISSPLQNVVAGDWYTPTTGKQETEYFKDITFNTTDNNRLNPAVYQRSWSTGANIVESGNANTPVSFNTEWSAAYNDASVPYTAGGGFSIKAVSGQKTPLLFRFPKADTEYAVSTGEIDRSNSGKLFISQLVNRSDPFQYNSSNEISTTLTPSADGKYLMVGNPFMASMDVQAFMEANKEVLAQKYWYTSDLSTAAVTYNEETQTWSEGTYLLPPYAVFYVEALNSTQSPVAVKFNANMQKIGTSLLQNETDNSLKITAESAKGKTYATLFYANSAANSYGQEDAELIQNLDGNNTQIPTVYTVADNKAVSANQVKDSQRIPLGIFASDDSQVNLIFTGTGTIRNAALYDAQTGTETTLYDGFELNVAGATHGRYFIVGNGNATGISNPTEVSQINIASVVPHQIIVTSDTEISKVSIWTTDGMLIKQTQPNGYTCTAEGLDSGIAIVRIETTSGCTIKKVMIK